jgi:hypothetical protein
MPPALEAGLSSLTLDIRSLPKRTIVFRSRDEINRLPATHGCSAQGTEGIDIEQIVLPDDAHWADEAWLTAPWNIPATLRTVSERLQGLLP